MLSRFVCFSVVVLVLESVTLTFGERSGLTKKTGNIIIAAGPQQVPVPVPIPVPVPVHHVPHHHLPHHHFPPHHIFHQPHEPLHHLGHLPFSPLPMHGFGGFADHSKHVEAFGIASKQHSGNQVFMLPL